jgi:hypothetical protein
MRRRWRASRPNGQRRARIGTAHRGDELGDAAVQRGWSGVGRTAGVEIKVVTRRCRRRRQWPMRSLIGRDCRNDHGWRRQYQRVREIDIAAKCAEILRQAGRRLLPRRHRTADRIARRTGGNRGCVGDADTRQMDMAEGKYELAGQCEQGQPSISTGVRSEPPHRSRPCVRRRGSISQLDAAGSGTSVIVGSGHRLEPLSFEARWIAAARACAKRPEVAGEARLELAMAVLETGALAAKLHSPGIGTDCWN